MLSERWNIFSKSLNKSCLSLTQKILILIAKNKAFINFKVWSNHNLTITFSPIETSTRYRKRKDSVKKTSYLILPLTYGKAYAEGYIGDRIHAAVDRHVPYVNQMTHDRHHGRINHSCNQIWNNVNVTFWNRFPLTGNFMIKLLIFCFTPSIFLYLLNPGNDPIYQPISNEVPLVKIGNL